MVGQGNEGLKKWQIYLDKYSYKAISKNIGYIIFYFALVLIYIGMSNKAISYNKILDKQEKELKELKWKHMDMQSKLMLQTTEMQMIEKSKELGLHSLEHPVFEIKVPQEKEN